MKTEKLRIRSVYDGLPLSVLISLPDTDMPRMVLQLAHGMCGTKDRFSPVMEFMASHGVACIANDHRGHGNSVYSEDDLGYMYDGGSDALVEDMVQMTVYAHGRFHGLPVFLLGHSMGSMAARVFVQRHDDLIDGLIISGSPSWNPLSRLGYSMMSLIDSIGAGRMRPSLLLNAMSWFYNRRFSSEGPDAWTCSDPQVREDFKNNPFCNYTFTVNGTMNILSLMIETYNNTSWVMNNIDMPVFFISGEDDPCIRSEKCFHDAALDMYGHGYHNLTSAIYGGMRHEILNEKEKENVWNDILLFMNSNLHKPIRFQT